MIVGTASLLFLFGTILLVLGIMLHRLLVCHRWRNGQNRREHQLPYSGKDKRRAASITAMGIERVSVCSTVGPRYLAHRNVDTNS